jgi:RNA polymerase sigma-70 factor (ECF subfamily)
MDQVPAGAVAESATGALEGVEDALWAYREDVAAFARILCRNPADAEDVAHAALVRAAGSAWRGDRQDLRLWLHRLAALECRAARKRRHDPSLERLIERVATADEDGCVEDVGALPVPDPAALTMELETRREVLAALDRLPERSRKALVLRDGAGAGLAEVAAALGTTPDAAKALVHRARAAVRRAVRIPI